jgi:hypothetical protein
MKKDLSDVIERLKSGEIIDVVDASCYAFGICIGDFRDVGMSVKNTWRTGMNWTWKGPGSIRMNGVVYTPGSETEEIDMDWS